jgi:hypothetical protein
MSATELTDAHVQQIEQSASWLAKQFAGLLRESPQTLNAYLAQICSSFSVKGTKTSAHCHFVGLDGNGRPRISDLATLLANSIIQYCIPRNEIERARRSLIEKNNPRDMVAVSVKARDLFSHLSTSGEGGELLLYYMLIESVLRLPQVLCKMALKTSSNVHYHGVDGIHATVDEATGMLAVYWGEAKLHADVNDAIRECFESVAPCLPLSSQLNANGHTIFVLTQERLASLHRLNAALSRSSDPRMLY